MKAIILILTFTIGLEAKSQKRIRGIFTESVGYTLSEFNYDSTCSCNRLVDIIYIDSINIEKQLSVIFYSGSFTALKTLRKKDRRKLIFLDSAILFDFARGYKTEFNPNYYYERILIGKVLSNGSVNKFILSKSKCKFYQVIKTSPEWRMLYKHFVICSAKRRKFLNPVYILNNVDNRRITDSEIRRLALTVLPQSEISYEVCH